jgi:hypothetical protein
MRPIDQLALAIAVGALGSLVALIAPAPAQAATPAYPNRARSPST